MGHEINHDADKAEETPECRFCGWLPVKDRLPEAETEVLVLCPVFGKLRVRIGVLAKNGKIWGSIGVALEPAFFPFGTEPLFWRPLPELPNIRLKRANKGGTEIE